MFLPVVFPSRFTTAYKPPALSFLMISFGPQILTLLIFLFVVAFKPSLSPIHLISLIVSVVSEYLDVSMVTLADLISPIIDIPSGIIKDFLNLFVDVETSLKFIVSSNISLLLSTISGAP